MKTFLLAASFLLLGSCGGGAPDIVVSDAWARSTVAGQASAAAYMTIANRGSASDRLVTVAAEPPANASLHETSSDGGVSSMRPLDGGSEIPARGSLELKPLGAHVMITGLAAPLAPGSSLPLTLRFERSGERRVAVRIVDAAAGGGG